jgi:trafficking protein particle complex subunit 3
MAAKGGPGGQSAYAKAGENIFAKNAKVSAELLTLTYGAFLHRLIKDDAGSSSSGSGENAEEVNAILDKMGYNIGCRMVDEFFAKSPSQGLCKDFTDTARVLGE